jgi:ribosomal protein L11 methyltransferase
VSWIQLQWQLRSDQVTRAEALLNEHGAVAVVLQSLADEVVLEPDPGATPIWQEVHLKAFFPLELDVANLGLALKNLDPQIHDHCEFDFVAEQDWQAALQQQAVEQQFAGRLWLLPKSADRSVDRGGAACLYLDAGLAFGSGSHPTTRMCLNWMAGAIQPGQRVLDFGCGSGILAIAAVLLGATAVGIDHDDQAVLATADNAHYNGVGLEQLQVFSLLDWQANGARASRVAFDLVAANILAGPLQQLAEHFCDVLRPGGHVVLSGILPEQTGEVMAAYALIDFAEPVIEDGWACLVGTKQN